MDSDRLRNGRRLQLPRGEAYLRRLFPAPKGLSLFATLAILPVSLLGCGTGPSKAAGQASPSPSPRASCSGLSRIPTMPTAVPLRVERTGPTVRVLVPMCVDGRGPFPFVLDTGSSSTLFDTHFLDHVRLPTAAPSLLHQPGCATVVLHVSVNRWSFGQVGLATQSVAVVRMPGFGLGGQPMGLIGSDVLSRFGAVRIDYRAQLLTVAGPEGPTPAQGTSIEGPTATPVPSGLLGDGARTAVPLDVSTTASGTSVLTPVRFGARGPFPFAVATGAGASAVTALLAAHLGLLHTGQSEPVRSFGCTRDAPVVRSGSWAINSVTLPPQQMTAAVPIASPSEAIGLVGSDALSAYGSLVLDFVSGSLFLGAGSSPT
jgi:hypothetical protein